MDNPALQNHGNGICDKNQATTQKGHNSFGCPHVISTNEGDVEKAEVEAGGRFVKNTSSSIIIIPALETMVSSPQQRQRKKDNDPSAAPPPSSSLEQVFVVKCTSCDKSVGLLVNDNFRKIEDLLRQETKSDGWLKVESESDELAFFVLNQIIYREYEVPDEDELEVEYEFPPSTDLVKILWNNGSAIGFYSVKPKGTFDHYLNDYYNMPVLDTLFIRMSDRRKGHALRAIQDVLCDFPGQNVGLSVPISLPMVKVVKKHLDLHASDRMRLWEVTGCGSEGNCLILWYLLNR